MLPTLPHILKEKNTLATFIVPAKYKRVQGGDGEPRVCAIIPTYAPNNLAYTLVQDLLRWNPAIQVCVVDDCTPEGNRESAKVFARIASVPKRVSLLRTPTNKLKAGALNYALCYIQHWSRESQPDVVLTLDDDVVINAETVKNLVRELTGFEHLGAVCSQSRVLNKNINLLTRLQGLEYLGFNAIRMADEGFIRGPLVMHGMLTAFRARALYDAGGFSEGHLIEDYEITTRLKSSGWSVKSIPHALAWTFVPETLSRLWRQRTRWSYGGLIVVTHARRLSSVFQDILGHSIFFATISMVAVLYFSQGSGIVPQTITHWIIGLSLFQLGISYAFQLFLMRLYKEKDTYDWLIRGALLPEFIYSYIMTAALLGSYVFYCFNLLKKAALRRPGAVAQALGGAGERFFRTFGYTESWGTRRQSL